MWFLLLSPKMVQNGPAAAAQDIEAISATALYVVPPVVAQDDDGRPAAAQDEDGPPAAAQYVVPPLVAQDKDGPPAAAQDEMILLLLPKMKMVLLLLPKM